MTIRIIMTIHIIKLMRVQIRRRVMVLIMIKIIISEKIMVGICPAARWRASSSLCSWSWSPGGSSGAGGYADLEHLASLGMY